MGGNRRGSFGGRYEPPPTYDYLGETESAKVSKTDTIIFILACIALAVVLAFYFLGYF